eukprot:COSAG05_NODE_19589_length_289_cov_1.047120_1_plen_33_part_01
MEGGVWGGGEGGEGGGGGSRCPPIQTEGLPARC